MEIEIEKDRLIIRFDRFTTALLRKLCGDNLDRIYNYLEDVLGSALRDDAEDILKGRD